MQGALQQETSIMYLIYIPCFDVSCWDSTTGDDSWCTLLSTEQIKHKRLQILLCISCFCFFIFCTFWLVDTGAKIAPTDADTSVAYDPKEVPPEADVPKEIPSEEVPPKEGGADPTMTAEQRNEAIAKLESEIRE